MNIKDYLKYYIGQYWRVTNLASKEYVDGDYGTDFFNSGLLRELSLDNVKAKPILRRIESLTEAEMIGLLQSIVPSNMADKPTCDDYSLEMFYNDGGNLVDEDVAIGANYSCRCYEGQIGIRKNGDIDFFDEEGNRERVSNLPQSFHYLLSLGIDLFGLIDAGLAVDAATLNQEQKQK